MHSTDDTTKFHASGDATGLSMGQAGLRLLVAIPELRGKAEDALYADYGAPGWFLLCRIRKCLMSFPVNSLTAPLKCNCSKCVSSSTAAHGLYFWSCKCVQLHINELFFIPIVDNAFSSNYTFAAITC